MAGSEAAEGSGPAYAHTPLISMLRLTVAAEGSGPAYAQTPLICFHQCPADLD